MTDTAIWVLSMLISAAIVALVWLFVEMFAIKKRVWEIGEEMHHYYYMQDNIKRNLYRIEEQIAKETATRGEKREVSGDA